MMPAARLSSALWTLLALLAAAGLAALAVRGAPIQTDLLALLPVSERSAAAEQAVRAMERAAGNRAVFLLWHRDPAVAKRAARDFAQSLSSSPAFARVQAEVQAPDVAALGASHRDFRFGLLTDEDRSALADERFDVEQWLLERINDPFRPGLGGGMAQDPFGLFGNFVAALPYQRSHLDVEDGLLVAREPQAPGGTYVLVHAELAASAYDEKVQRAASAAVAAAEGSAGAAGVEVLRAGTVFFAEAARRSAERDMTLIATGSLAGILLLMLAVFRSLRPIALGLATVLVGVAAAVSAGVAVHGELHVLTLVFGASLIGEAVDYSIQYFGVHAAAGARWDARRGMATVRPALTLALATSALGYAAMLCLPFPAVQQIAVFALAGLMGAYVAALLLLPRLVRAPYLGQVTPLAQPAGRFAQWWRARVSPRAAAAAAAVGVALCAPGWVALGIDDDVRSLTPRPPALLAQEARVRAITGMELGTRFFVVEAGTAEDVLRAEEALTARLRGLAAEGALEHYHAVSSFVPSVQRQAENHELLGKTIHVDDKRLELAFDRAGLRTDIGPALERAYREAAGRWLTPQAWLDSPASTPFRHLWLGERGGAHASVVVPLGARSVDALAAAAVGLPGVHFVDKVASVSGVFAEYRVWLAYGVAAAVLVMLALLALRYGLRGGAAALVPPLLGISAALALAGYTGRPMTLFAVAALMLVLGVGVNYSIFLIEGRARAGIATVAVGVSALTTVLSFGLLAFSATPALAGFGATLLAGVAVAVLAAPLALSLGSSGEG